MRTVIIDDERPSLELLKRIIGKNRHLEIVGEFMDVKEAVEQMETLLPDVIFTDIEMPYLSGINFASIVGREKEDVQVVFVTAYEEYALDAFEVNAVNYILKPMTEESLNITVARLLKYYKPKENLWQQEQRKKINSFGNFQVYGGIAGELVKWPTSKSKELFAYFLCEKEKESDKWQLCDILWPDAVPEKASHSLHSAINRMKSALKAAGIEAAVTCDKGKYRMDLQDFLWDAEEMMIYFKHNPMVTKANAFHYEKILNLYQGELFDTEDYPWAIEFSENIKRSYLEGRRKIADYYMDCKNYHQADKHLQKIIYTDPGNEEAASHLMELYFLTGNKVQLVHCYKRLEEYLERELHIEPKESTRKLYHRFLKSPQKL